MPANSPQPNMFLILLSFLALIYRQIECKDVRPICELNRGSGQPVARKITAQIVALEEIKTEEGNGKKIQKVAKEIFKEEKHIYFTKNKGGFYFDEAQKEEELTKLKERRKTAKPKKSSRRRKQGNQQTPQNVEEMKLEDCDPKKIPARNIYFEGIKNGKLTFKTKHNGFFKKRLLQITVFLIFNGANECTFLTPAHNYEPHKKVDLYKCPEGICQKETIFYFAHKQKEMFILEGYEYKKIVEQCEKTLKEIAHEGGAPGVGNSQQNAEMGEANDGAEIRAEEEEEEAI